LTSPRERGVKSEKENSLSKITMKISICKVRGKHQLSSIKTNQGFRNQIEKKMNTQELFSQFGHISCFYDSRSRAVEDYTCSNPAGSRGFRKHTSFHPMKSITLIAINFHIKNLKPIVHCGLLVSGNKTTLIKRSAPITSE
jgi:hypothetical protein